MKHADRFSSFPKVLAISISERKGHCKKNVQFGMLRVCHGLVGAAHAGDCIMPIRSLFASVEASGEIRLGDPVRLIEHILPRQPMPALEPVTG